MIDLQDLVREHEQAMFNFAMQLTRSEDDSYDLLQDTWIKCMVHQQMLIGMTVPKQRSWLFTVLKNRWVDICRKRKLEQNLQSQVERPVTNPAPVLDISRHLDKLPELEQQIVRLRFWEQLNSREISEKLDIPEGTVRWRLKQALDQLRRYIEKSDKEERCQL
jgi:RNA polymerase sigma-70 factor (ECF subfamily)